MIMKVLSIIWTVFKNLVVLGVFAGALALAVTPLQNVAMAGVVLMYINMMALHTLMVRFRVESHITDIKRFLRLSTLLNEDPEDIEGLKEEITATTEMFAGTTVKYYINLAFNCIISLICMVVIISAVL